MNFAVTHAECLSPAFATLLPQLRITVLAILRQAPKRLMACQLVRITASSPT
jgi:hypothetical protein